MNAPQLSRVSEHVYWLPADETTDRPVLGAVVKERATVMVDAGNSPAHADRILTELAKADAPEDDPIEIADAFLTGLRRR